METKYATPALAGEVERRLDWTKVALAAGTVVLTLATSYIHVTLGSMLFLLNAAGYAGLAVALIAPIGLFARFRWLIRLGLLGFTLATIGGWILMGARIPIAYLDKAIEVALVALLAASVYRFDGGPLGVLGRLRALPADVRDLVGGLR